MSINALQDIIKVTETLLKNNNNDDKLNLLTQAIEKFANQVLAPSRSLTQEHTFVIRNFCQIIDKQNLSIPPNSINRLKQTANNGEFLCEYLNKIPQTAEEIDSWIDALTNFQKKYTDYNNPISTGFYIAIANLCIAIITCENRSQKAELFFLKSNAVKVAISSHDFENSQKTFDFCYRAIILLDACATKHAYEPNQTMKENLLLIALQCLCHEPFDSFTQKIKEMLSHFNYPIKLDVTCCSSMKKRELTACFFENPSSHLISKKWVFLLENYQEGLFAFVNGLFANMPNGKNISFFSSVEVLNYPFLHQNLEYLASLDPTYFKTIASNFIIRAPEVLSQLKDERTKEKFYNILSHFFNLYFGKDDDQPICQLEENHLINVIKRINAANENLQLMDDLSIDLSRFPKATKAFVRELIVNLPQIGLAQFCSRAELNDVCLFLNETNYFYIHSEYLKVHSYYFKGLLFGAFQEGQFLNDEEMLTIEVPEEDYLLLHHLLTGSTLSSAITEVEVKAVKDAYQIT